MNHENGGGSRGRSPSHNWFSLEYPRTARRPNRHISLRSSSASRADIQIDVVQLRIIQVWLSLLLPSIFGIGLGSMRSSIPMRNVLTHVTTHRRCWSSAQREFCNKWHGHSQLIHLILLFRQPPAINRHSPTRKKNYLPFLARLRCCRGRRCRSMHRICYFPFDFPSMALWSISFAIFFVLAIHFARRRHQTVWLTLFAIDKITHRHSIDARVAWHVTAIGVSRTGTAAALHYSLFPNTFTMPKTYCLFVRSVKNKLNAEGWREVEMALAAFISIYSFSFDTFPPPSSANRCRRYLPLVSQRAHDDVGALTFTSAANVWQKRHCAPHIVTWKP